MTLKSLVLAIGLVMTAPILAQNETAASLTEEEIKERSEAISKTLRCVVCQNQPISDSNADLAASMREVVEARVRQGDSDEEVRLFMQERYGDFVLMKPPLKPYTLALWFGPVVLLVIGGVWYVMTVSKRKTTLSTEEDNELTQAEKARLDAVLNLESKKDQAP